MGFIKEFLMFLGRLCIAPVFMYHALHRMLYYRHTLELLNQRTIPYAPFLLGLAFFIELLGGFFLFLGKNTRFWAMVLAIYLVPNTLILYNFWDFSTDAMHIMLNLFLNNCALFGALLYIIANGPGLLSIDSAKRKKQEQVVISKRESAQNIKSDT